MNPKTLLLVALAVLSFLSGAVRQYSVPGGDLVTPSDVGFALVSILLIFLWYRFDTDIRNYPRSLWLNVGVIAVAVIALPYYFFRSRGTKGGFRALGWFMILLIAFYALDLAGGYLTYYVLQS